MHNKYAKYFLFPSGKVKYSFLNFNKISVVKEWTKMWVIYRMFWKTHIGFYYYKKIISRHNYIIYLNFMFIKGHLSMLREQVMQLKNGTAL